MQRAQAAHHPRRCPASHPIFHFPGSAPLPIPCQVPLTVFAPTNEAFELALGALNVTLEDVVANTELLTNILA